MGSSLRRSHRAWLLKVFGVLAICFATVCVTAGVVGAEPLELGENPALLIGSDKDDYAPGELVRLSSFGWQAGEAVHVFVNDEEGRSWSHHADVTAGEDGIFEYDVQLPSHFVATYTVTATGDASGYTTLRFADSIAAGTSLTASNTGGSTISINAPVTPVGGLIVAQIVATDSVSSTRICPQETGWQTNTAPPNNLLIRDSQNKIIQQVFWRVATAANAAVVPYTWQFRTGNCPSSGSAQPLAASGGTASYTGVDTTSPIDAAAGTGATSSGGTATAPAVTTTASDAFVLRFIGVFKNTPISPTTVPPKIYEARSSSSKERAAAAYGATQVAAGGTGTFAATFASAEWVAQTVALRAGVTNAPPSGTNKTITTAEDTPHTFAGLDFGFTDTDAGDTMSAVRIDTLSLAAGSTLKLSGANVTAGQVIPTASVPNLVFAPAPNASGAPYASFTFSVRDTNGPAFDTSPNTMTVNVTAVDDSPVAVDDTRTVAEDSGASTVNVLANDTDSDGGPKTIASVTQPPNGDVVVAGDNLSLTYEPDANYCNGGSPTDDFTYTLNGGSTADVAVTVTCINDAPVCGDITLTTDEDTVGATAADCMDVEGSPLTYTASPATTGVSGVDGSDLTYDPNGQFEHLDDGENGTDAFTYTANDGSVDSAPAGVDVTVDGVNDAPTCAAVEITTDENTPGSAPASCTDVDGEALTYSAGPAATGDSGVDGSDLTYDPNGQFEHLDDLETGTDAFTYKANDGTVDSADADVDVTIDGVNDAPTCEDVAITVSEGGPAAGTAPDCTDAEDDPLTYTVGLAGTGVAATASGPFLTYDPNGQFEHLDDLETGTDAFTYTANDGDVDSAAADVDVTIDGVNDAPVCEDVEITTDENTVGSTGSDCTDVDGEPLTYTATAASTGVSGVDGSDLTYDPNGQFEHLDDLETGTDAFTYTANDGDVDSAPAGVDVTVDGVNDAPVCEDVEITTDENTVGSIAADCTDVDGEPLTYTATAASTGVSGVDGSDLTYDPNGQFEHLDDLETGTDAFTYTANDGDADSAAADVDVTIDGVNDAPTCADVEITTDENTAGSTASDCTDVEGDELTYSAGPATTGVSGVDGSDLTYDPNGQFEHLDDGETGSDAFTYTANDGTVDSAAADVDVTINGVNDAPVCEDVEITTDENTVGSTASDCTDVDGEPLTYTATAASTGVSGVDGSDLTYDPNGQFEHLDDLETGTDAFTYTANDGTVDSAAADVDVTIDGVNDAPVCEDVEITTDENTVGSTGSDCTDVEGDELTYSAGPATTGVSGVDGNDLTYDPNGQFEHLDDGENGNDSFTYTANDGTVDSADADVDVTVGGINDAPVCADVSITTDENTVGSTGSDCTDAEDDPLTYAATSADTGVSGVDGSDLTYDPNGQFEHLGDGDTGSDAFTYIANDGDVDSASANVSVTIDGINDAPVCVDVAITTNEDTAGSTAPDCTDAEGDDLTHAVGPAGTGDSGVSGSDLTYDPAGQFEHLDDGETGSDSFGYTANDGVDDSAPANVSVTIDGINDAPVCMDVAITTDEDTAGSTASDCTDAESDPLIYVASAAGTGVSGVDGSDLTYDPNGQFEHLGTGDTGTDGFTYTANDGDADSALADVAVTITGVNDEPVVELTGPASANEGETKSYVIDTTDPDSTTFALDAHACGAGASVVADSLEFDTATGDGGFNCLFADDDPTATSSDTAEVGATVSDGEAADGDTVEVTVSNRVPTVVVASPMSGTYPVGATITVIATFTDAGTGDTHTCTVNGSAGTVAYTGPGAGTCTGTASPSSAGPFAITVVVADDDIGSGSAGSLVNVLYAIYAHEKCSGGSGKGLIVNGPDADIDGGMHSNGNFKVDGQNFQSGTASLYRPQSGCTTSYQPTRVNFGAPSPTAPVNVPLKSWPWNPVKADFTCTFTKDEFLFNKAGQVIPSGVYCANKLFKINASNVSGIITVIAPEIALNGKNIDLFPHSKDVLLLGTGTKEIVLDGDLTPDTIGGFTGLVHNPGGGVKVNGKAISTYRAYIQALWVEINLAGFRMRY
jgi:VCBS repeat-containing protein